LGRALARLSHMVLLSDDLEKALRAAVRGEKAADAAKDDLGRANCITSRGDVLFRLGENAPARQAYDGAEALYQKVGDDLGRANCIKSRGNVLDPWTYIDRFGADCIRWYLYSSSAPWKSRRIVEAAVQEPLYRFLDTLRNTYDFFALYATIDGYEPDDADWGENAQLAFLDRWILSILSFTITEVTAALDAYDPMKAAMLLESFVSDVSNWYIRLSRRRFWRGGMGSDKRAAYGTLYRVLMEVSKLSAPFVPFISEAIYQRLRRPQDPESVHLAAYPSGEDWRRFRDKESNRGTGVEAQVSLARLVVSLGHKARDQGQVKVRQPLRNLVVAGTPSWGGTVLLEDAIELIRAELNVDAVVQKGSLDSELDLTAAPNFKTLGPRLGAVAPRVAAWIKQQNGYRLRQELSRGSAQVGVGEQTASLLPEDVVFTTVVPPGFVLAGDAGIQVLLNVQLDDELMARGLFREVVHRIQVARKEAGFDVTDRIRLAYEADPVLALILADHEEEIAAEVLAAAVCRDVSGEHEHTETIELDGERRVVIGLTRVWDA
ncbi:MAG: DUF5915 domain-containing protein, partial [bacterium]